MGRPVQGASFQTVLVTISYFCSCIALVFFITFGTMEQKGQPLRAAVPLSFAAIFIIWGTTYLAIRGALAGFPPFILGAIRFALAGVLLSAIVCGSGRFKWAELKAALLPGILLFLCGNGAVTYVEQRVPSAIVALAPALIPLLVLVLEWVLGIAPRPKLRTLCAFAVGVAGVALVLGGGSQLDGAAIRLADVSILLSGALAWALGTVLLRRNPPASSAIRSAALQMLVAAGGFFVVSILAGEELPHAPEIGAMLCLLYLAIFGSVIAVTAYTYLLLNVRPSIVSTYALVNPVIAMLVGALFGGEALSGNALIGGSLVVLSVASVLLPGLRGAAASASRRKAEWAQAPNAGLLIQAQAASARRDEAPLH